MNVWSINWVYAVFSIHSLRHLKLRNISPPDKCPHPVKWHLKSWPPAAQLGEVHRPPKNPRLEALQLACRKISQALIISKVSQHTDVLPWERLHLRAFTICYQSQGLCHITALTFCNLGSAGVGAGFNKGAVSNGKYWAIADSFHSKIWINQ